MAMLAVVLAAVAACVLLAAAMLDAAGAATRPGDNRVNMNEIQVIKKGR
jgi:hypothetical protein